MAPTSLPGQVIDIRIVRKRCPHGRISDKSMRNAFNA